MKSCKQKVCGILFTCLAIGVFSFYLVNLAVAAEYCVDTSAGLQSALTDAETNGEDDIIRVQQGTYYGNFPYSSTQANSLTIEGEYNHPKCKKRDVDFTNTVLDGEQNGVVLALSAPDVEADLALLIKKLFLEIGITRNTVSRCSSLSSSIKKADMKLKIKGIIVIKNIKIIGKFSSAKS